MAFLFLGHLIEGGFVIFYTYRIQRNANLQKQ